MNLLISLLVSGFAVFAASYILPGVSVDNFITSLIVALILGVVNTFLKPILVFLTLPINLITLGLFGLVINAVLILLVDYIVPGFSVDGFIWALLFGIVLSLISAVLNSATRR